MATVLVPRRGVSLPRVSQGQLVVRREDIQFADDGTGWVTIRVRVWNEGAGPSLPTRVHVEAAPLGAFVPGRRIAVLRVPRLAPGSAVELQTRARRPQVEPLGSPRTVKPADLLTALANPDPPWWRRRLRRNLRRAMRAFLSATHTLAVKSTRRREFQRRLRALLAAIKEEEQEDRLFLRVLPPDPLALLGREGTYWAGNINVFIGGRAVERHRAEALRIYPGRKNNALFSVGSGRDAYAFQFRGPGAAWNPTLLLADPSPPDFSGDNRIYAGMWVEVQETALVQLSVVPPEGCEQGELHVHVTQRSTGKEAVVEFSLDPHAAGPGCYVI